MAEHWVAHWGETVVEKMDSKMVLIMVARKVDRKVDIKVVYLVAEESAVPMVEQMVQQWVVKKKGVEVGPRDAWMVELLVVGLAEWMVDEMVDFLAAELAVLVDEKVLKGVAKRDGRKESKH
jgi:hypothetical protein